MVTFELILLGLFVGTLTGVTGASGILILVPILSTFFALPLIIILGTSLFVDVIATIPVTYNYAKAKNLEISEILWMIIGALLGAQVGSYFVISVSKIFIMAILSFAMLFFGFKMWKNGISKDNNFTIKISGKLYLFLKTLLGMFISGMIIGLATGIFGAGGGLTIFVILYSFLHYPIKKAIGTSSFIMLLTALSGLIGYWDNNNLDIKLGLIIGISAAVGGAFSSRLANKIDEVLLSKFISIFFIFLGIIMITLKVIYPLFGLVY